MKPNIESAYKFFHKATRVLSRVESNGIRIDTDYLENTIRSTSDSIRQGEEKLKTSEFWTKWKRRFGSSANMESTHQLGTLLFDVLGHKQFEKTEKGAYKTDEYSLRHVKEPFVKEFFALKKLRKVLSTYLLGIRREVCGGFLHPSYNLAGGIEDDEKGGAVSYRGSSSHPNFQNIPIRNKLMGKLIRQAVISRFKKGRVVERDFSGIEVRIAYCYHKDPTMRKYLIDPSSDMHGDQACVLFMLDRDQVIKSQTRDSAKNQWVFPQFYGSVWFQCAPAIWEAMTLRDFRVGKNGQPTDVTIRDHLRKKGITELGSLDPKSEPKKGTFARHLMEAEKKLWFERFPVYTKWKKDFYNRYLENGYFDLYTGFRCQGLYNRNQVINFPVQGAAFHCLLLAMILIQKELDERGMESVLIGQIHDSILGDVPDHEIQDYLDITEDVMTRRVAETWDWVTIPLEAEADVCPVGGNWHDKQTWKKSKSGLWELAP